jgi:hypothetical protein
MSGLTSAATGFRGTEQMRQKLFVVASVGLVNTSAPNEPAALVICGIQWQVTRCWNIPARNYTHKIQLHIGAAQKADR